MMGTYIRTKEELKKDLQPLLDHKIAEGENLGQYIGQLDDTQKELDILTFWPPRLIEAYKEKMLCCFFGAGLSIPSGLPTWAQLLDRLSVDQRYMEDTTLTNDPLTLAELAYHQLGAERLQILLRRSVSGHEPSLSHLFTAALKLPIYITSNYDTLFEESWALVNKNEELITILDDDDMLTEFPDGFNIENFLTSGKHYLVKIHGCVKDEDKLLILTRSEYRKHYRTNEMFFDFIEEVLSKFHSLFIGFSHSDPEVTRLVEDVIFQYESDKENYPKPNFYSLQFDMRKHTPEIFAAKGIVALDPPLGFLDDKNLSLRTALVDIITSAGVMDIDKYNRLYGILMRFRESINKQLHQALQIMADSKKKILKRHRKGKDIKSDMRELEDKLGELANQGVYFTDIEGTIIDFDEPDHLMGKVKKGVTNFGVRPYFKQAKTFKKPFISDSYSSIYNQNSTFFICEPIVEEDGTFNGLLFSAAQVGSWKLPLELAREAWAEGLNILLIDSNGVCLLPPNAEIEIGEHQRSVGYQFNDLLAISRRDRLVKRIMENIVPLDEDDDIHEMSGDLKYFSAVTQLEQANWKIGISKPIFKPLK